MPFYFLREPYANNSKKYTTQTNKQNKVSKNYAETETVDHKPFTIKIINHHKKQLLTANRVQFVQTLAHR